MAIASLSFCVRYGVDLTFATSFFSDQESSVKNTLSAGQWIPSVEMAIFDGENSINIKKTEELVFDESPCVGLSSSLEDANISYVITSETNEKIDGSYSEECIEIPHGIWIFEAWAFNKDNENWRSDKIIQKFNVKNTIIELIEDDKDNVDSIEKYDTPLTDDCLVNDMNDTCYDEKIMDNPIFNDDVVVQPDNNDLNVIEDMTDQDVVIEDRSADPIELEEELQKSQEIIE